MQNSNKKGFLIVLDGLDASGKETQTKKLYNRLCEDGRNIMRIECPNYEDSSSELVKMYLKGEFGSNPGDVNHYAASSFYAVDRFASYKKYWGKHYENGGIVLADRYTTSNAIYQPVKIADEKERERYLEWLDDFEYNKLSLPRPDAVFFIDMPPEFMIELLKKRNENNHAEDIHEKNYEFLKKCYENAINVSEKFGYERIKCVKDGKIRSIDDIHSEIYERLERLFETKL